MVLWDVITYSSVNLDKHFEGPVSWNIVPSALLKFSYVEMGSIEPGTAVHVTEMVCLTVCGNVILTFVTSLYTF
jgi:hypothetical protein